VSRCRIAQPFLRVLEFPLELLKLSVGSETRSVQLGAQQRYLVVAVTYIGSEQLDVPARTHRSNSDTA